MYVEQILFQIVVKQSEYTALWYYNLDFVLVNVQSWCSHNDNDVMIPSLASSGSQPADLNNFIS